MSYFDSLQPPLSPNVTEIQHYRDLIDELTLTTMNSPINPTTTKTTTTITKNPRILLLGFTKELQPLCTEFIDINPNHPYIKDSRSITGNWYFNISEQYDVIIGDGVLNLVSGSLVKHLSKYCKRLIIRFFVEKIDNMRYATWFRNNTEFLLPDKIITTQPKCKMLIWDFNQ